MFRIIPFLSNIPTYRVFPTDVIKFREVNPNIEIRKKNVPMYICGKMPIGSVGDRGCRENQVHSDVVRMPKTSALMVQEIVTKVTHTTFRNVYCTCVQVVVP